MKVETDFNTSIAASLIERAVIMYVETSKIDVIVLIGNVTYYFQNQFVDTENLTLCVQRKKCINSR